MKNDRKTRKSHLQTSDKKNKSPAAVTKLELRKRLSALSKTSRVTEAVKEQIEDRCSVSQNLSIEPNNSDGPTTRSRARGGKPSAERVRPSNMASRRLARLDQKLSAAPTVEATPEKPETVVQKKTTTAPLTLKPKRIMSKTKESPVRASIVIEHVPSPTKKDRSKMVGMKRTRKSRDQIYELQRVYEASKGKPTKEELEHLAVDTGLKLQQVYKWYWDMEKKNDRLQNMLTSGDREIRSPQRISRKIMKTQYTDEFGGYSKTWFADGLDGAEEEEEQGFGLDCLAQQLGLDIEAIALELAMQDDMPPVQTHVFQGGSKLDLKKRRQPSEKRPLIQMCPVPQESQPLEAQEVYEAPIADEEHADDASDAAMEAADVPEIEVEDDCAKEESVANNAGGMSQNGLNSLDRFSPENTHSVRQTNIEEMSSVLPLQAKRRSIVTSDKYEQNDQPTLINNHLLSRKSDDAPAAKEQSSKGSFQNIFNNLFGRKTEQTNMFTMPTKNSIFETPHFTRTNERKRQKMDEVAQSAFNLVPCKPSNNLLGGTKPSEPLKKASPLNTEKLLRGVVQQVAGGSKITPSQMINSATPSSGKGKVYNVFTGPVNVATSTRSKVLHMARGSPLSGLLRPTPQASESATSHNVINIFTQPIMQGCQRCQNCNCGKSN